MPEKPMNHKLLKVGDLIDVYLNPLAGDAIDIYFTRKTATVRVAAINSMFHTITIQSGIPHKGMEHVGANIYEMVVGEYLPYKRKKRVKK